ncbi:MAG TPA: hypothetical protein DCQ28_04575 [Bacteroidetes bacterium]|nr:hypothetical protein [Bacteroidota bacterium]
MKLEWDEAMSTGVKEVDDAHKLLMVWINKLTVDMRSGNGRKEIFSVLNFLEQYAALHFAHEEGCMLQYQCPSAESNKKAHEEFLEYFKRMKKQIETDGPTVKAVIDIKDAMGNWLKNHIMKTDICLAQCVKDGSTAIDV